MEKPVSAITIKDISDATIFVKKNSSGLETKVGHSPPEFYPGDKYRTLVFSRIKNSHVFVMTKTIAILFERCENVNVDVRSKVVSNIQIFQCKDTRVDEYNDIPFNYVEHSSGVSFFQDASPHQYLVQASHQVKAHASDSIGVEDHGRSSNISNMFEERKMFTVSRECYDVDVYHNPYETRRLPVVAESVAIPIPRTGRDLWE